MKKILINKLKLSWVSALSVAFGCGNDHQKNREEMFEFCASERDPDDQCNWYKNTGDNCREGSILIVREKSLFDSRNPCPMEL